jgi:glycosyltransferase involved in cell wall biosynthesis
MTVLSVAYPMFAVGPDASGGAEQILFLLEREIAAAGCQSVVVAAEGSIVEGRLIATPASVGEITEQNRRDAQNAHLAAITTALQDGPVDLIHFHGLDFHAYVPKTTVPMLATLHLPLEWYPESIFKLRDVTLNCVSQTQASGHGLPVILNGVDTSRYRPAETKDGYLLWLGRICPEKGVHIALQVAHALDLDLIVAGPVHGFRAHRDYFEAEVRPLLDPRRRYLGSVGGLVKSELLSRAQCLLAPSLVAETSSLVAMEAISSGTAVVAFRSGALPEVVEHGLTGFIVSSPDEMCEAVKEAWGISPGACRSVALDRFDSRRMAHDYFDLYKRHLGVICAPQDNLYGSSPRRKFQDL